MCSHFYYSLNLFFPTYSFQSPDLGSRALHAHKAALNPGRSSGSQAIPPSRSIPVPPAAGNDRFTVPSRPHHPQTLQWGQPSAEAPTAGAVGVAELDKGGTAPGSSNQKLIPSSQRD